MYAPYELSSDHVLSTALESPATYVGEFDGDGCLDFIAKFREYAWSNGTDRDSEWMARSAPLSFRGHALLWYEGLDKETQDNWDLLRPAMIANYVTAVSR